MPKKKVLFLLEGFDKGGIEKVTLDIVNNLDLNKYDITIQTFWYGGYCQSLVDPRIKVIPFFFKRHVKGIIRLIEWLPSGILYKLFVHGDYDVEIAASDGGAAKVISGSTNKKAKKICWVHMDVICKGSVLKDFQRRSTANKVYSKFDRIVCVSEYAKRQFVKKFGNRERVLAIQNPINKEEIIKKAYEPPSIVFNNYSFNIVSVGSLVDVKGFDRLITVCGKLKKLELMNLTLYIIGDGPLLKQLERIVLDNSFDNIRFLGFKPNPYKYIRQANLYVCSSYSEAFPLTIGECFSLGIPVLGTRNSGVCEWLESDGSGIIVENNEEALYEGIKEMVQNRILYLEMERKSYEKSKKIVFSESIRLWEKTVLGG